MRKRDLVDENARLNRQVKHLLQELAEARLHLYEAQSTYQAMVLPTLAKAQTAHRSYIEHLRHCPDPDAGEEPHE